MCLGIVTFILAVIGFGLCGIVFSNNLLHPAFITPSPWWYLLDVLAALEFASWRHG